MFFMAVFIICIVLSCNTEFNQYDYTGWVQATGESVPESTDPRFGNSVAVKTKQDGKMYEFIVQSIITVNKDDSLYIHNSYVRSIKRK